MGQGQELQKTNGAPAVHREEFGASQTQIIRETAATAVAAREKAAVEARYVMALQRPRNIEKTRQELLRACNHPDFAEEAWYSRPVGKKFNKDTREWEDEFAEGFSIRFAEEAIRAFGNVYPELAVVFESEDTRIVRITVTDMEANVPYSTEIVLRKRVERKKLKDGQEALSERLNSEGKKVYTVEATEDEVLQRQNSLRSKAMRTDGLRLIPAWLKVECKKAIFATMDGKFKADPEAAKRKIIDGFASLEIEVAELEKYLGKRMEQVTHRDLLKMQPLYTALKDGETTWDSIMASRSPSPDEKNGSKEAAQRVAEEKLREAKPDADDSTQDAATTEQSETTPASEEAAKNQGGFKFGGRKQ